MTDSNTSLTDPGSDTIDIICDNVDLSGFKFYKFTSNCGKLVDKYGTFRIMKKILTGNISLPNLVVMAGFSTSSFCATANIVIKNMNKITHKFNAIYLLKYDEDTFKGLQTAACGKRDELKSNPELQHEEQYKPEIDLNEELGIVVDRLLRCAGLTNVHLLGKCAGAGVAIHAFTKSDIYSALYLAVPASPVNIQHLLGKGKVGKKFIFAWDKRDKFPFSWGRKSFEEATIYEANIGSLVAAGNEVITRTFNEDTDVSHEKIYHEIPDELFDIL